MSARARDLPAYACLMCAPVVLSVVGCGDGSSADSMTPSATLPEVVALLPADPSDLVNDDQGIYVSFRDADSTFARIIRVDKQTGELLNLTETGGDSWCLTVADGLVYFDDRELDDTTGRVAKLGTSGGETTTVSDVPASNLVLHEQDLYQANHDLTGPGLLARSSIQTGEFVDLSWDGIQPTQLAVDSEALWVVDTGSPGQAFDDAIYRLPYGSSEPVEFAADLPNLWGLVVDSSRVFALDDQGSGTLYAFDKLSGEREVVAQGFRYAAVLTADDERLYWGTWGGEIMSVSKAGGDVETLVENLGSITELTIDGGFLYWVDGDSHELLRLEK